MKLFYLDGKKAGDAFVLIPPGISIGREMDNDIVLDSEGSSRYHSKLEWGEDGWKVRDLGSTNGTKVNGVKITAPTLLKEGDKIKIGSQILLFGEKLYNGLSEKASQKTVGDEKKTESHSTPTLTEISPEELNKDKKLPFLDFFDKKNNGKSMLGGFEDKINIFSKKETGSLGVPADASKKRRAHLLFYVIVILTAFILLSLFVLIEKMYSDAPQKTIKSSLAEPRGIPLTVIYEKQITTADNIFRYELTIRGDIITVTRDDLKCHVRFKKEKQITKEQLRDIEDGVKQTDFMNLQPPQAGVSSDGVDEVKELVIAYGKNLNSIRIKNTFEPTAFKEIVRLLEDFSETVLNIPPVSLTAAEMQEEAQIAFDKAEQLFLNYQAQDANLKEALKRYQVVVELLEYFEPKPAMYDKAFSQLQEVKRILLEEIKAHNSNVIRYQRLNDWDKAKEEYRKIMNKLEPDDKRHQQARDKILKIEKNTKSGGKK